MVENIIQRIVDAVKEASKQAASEAYAAGYEDASRRMHEMYVFGFQRGWTDAKLEEMDEEINLDDLDEDLDPSVFEEVSA
jgi:hypothetical protein